MKAMATVLGAAAVLAAGGAGAAERPVKMKDLPPAVQETLQRETKGQTVVGLTVQKP
jgi:hypothetical protein